MKHKVFGRKLGRDINQRSALLRNLSSSVLLEGFVVTTQAKAKFVKSYLEKLIRNSQKKSLATKREIASVLSKGAFDRLQKEISPGMAGRAGGYTKITHLNTRRGDGAQMARLELMPFDKPSAKSSGMESKKQKSPEKKKENKK